MEAISNIIGKHPELAAAFEKQRMATLAHPEIVAFIAHHQLSDDAIARSYAQFYEYVTEKEKLEKSYLPTLVLSNGYAEVVYKEMPENARQLALQEKSARIQLIGLPERLKKVTLSDVEKLESRLAVLSALTTFIQNPSAAKGIYLYGDFGVGKSFILASMANSLADYGYKTTLVHYPTFIAESTYDNYRARVENLKTAPILVLDDIGAETNSNWVRDSILQVILQYRMDNSLPTFFTSNLSMADLEAHLAETRNEKDIWPAKRVMERIHFLAKEIHLEGVNRRHE
ncbi:MAG: primosomal protein DnaI [Streptococcaceae bacterium]|jgi:primosomal protein DnaI|nr:primosomal protein DnaI [Streptococcaceae bacterium]